MNAPKVHNQSLGVTLGATTTECYPRKDPGPTAQTQATGCVSLSPLLGWALCVPVTTKVQMKRETAGGAVMMSHKDDHTNVKGKSRLRVFTVVI